MRIAVGILVAISLLNVGSAFAKQDKNRMEGATTYTLFLDNSSLDRTGCVVTDEELRSGFDYPISSSKLKEHKFGDLYITLLLNTLVSSVGDRQIGCVFNVRLVSTFGKFTNIGFNNKSSYFETTLFEKAAIGIAPVDVYKRRIKNRIEEFTKFFITEYNNQNK
jgi:hypothetical protein